MMARYSSLEPPKEDDRANGDWNRDELLAMVSHEILNSTQIIISWIELICVRQASGESLSQGLEVIRRNGQLQAGLIRQLLEISRQKSGNFSLDDRKIALVPILETAVKTMTPQALAKAIKLHAEFEPSAASIIGDAAQLEEVFTNLLANAIKFTPGGGRIDVRFRCWQGCAQITVSDTGRGISAEFLPHIFDLFRQEKRDLAGQHGMGLGTAIARYIVERHKGKIYALSAGEGKGATFIICFPLQSNAVEGKPRLGMTSAPDHQ